MLASLGTNLARLEARSPSPAALVKLDVNQSIPNATWTVVSWEAANYDTAGFWDAANPTRLTVPAGVSWVRLYSQVGFANNTTGTRITKMGRNSVGGLGTSFAGMPWVLFDAFQIEPLLMQAHSAPTPVVPGDWFTVHLWQDSGAALNLRSAEKSFFAIEVLR